jgi:UDP-3-O-[3-hydroxymyristoyl] glucosamine N-acyltransferase
LAKIRFFLPSVAPSLAEVATWCSAALASQADAGRVITDVAALDQAGPGDLTFLDNPKYLDVF